MQGQDNHFKFDYILGAKQILLIEFGIGAYWFK